MAPKFIRVRKVIEGKTYLDILTDKQFHISNKKEDKTVLLEIPCEDDKTLFVTEAFFACSRFFNNPETYYTLTMHGYSESYKKLSDFSYFIQENIIRDKSSYLKGFRPTQKGKARLINFLKKVDCLHYFNDDELFKDNLSASKIIKDSFDKGVVRL